MQTHKPTNRQFISEKNFANKLTSAKSIPILQPSPSIFPLAVLQGKHS